MKRREGAALPWYLRWKLPPERPMLLFVGRRGSGKSLAATDLIIRRLKAGEAVYANYPVEWWERGELRARAGYVGSLLDCIGLEDATVVIDEASTWCSSREWQSLPPQVVSDWQQSRKRSIQWVFTAQHEARVDVTVRELADWVVICRRGIFVPRWVPFFSLTQTYLEDINEARRHEGGRRYWRWYPHRVFDAYSTSYEVPRMDAVRLKEYRQRLKEGKPVEDFIGETLVHPEWY